MLRLFCFTVYNTKCSPTKNYKMCRRKWRLDIVMGFQNANENECHGFGNLAIWLWKVMEIFLKFNQFVSKGKERFSKKFGNSLLLYSEQ